MKKLLFTFIIAVFATVSYAQITLTQSNITIPSNKTQVKYWTVLPGASLNVISTGTNQTWNFSTLNTGIADSFSFAPNTNSNFSSAAMALNSQVNITPANYVIGKQIRSEDASGLYTSGYYFTDSAYVLSTGPKDTFYMPSQSVVYKNRQNILAFPATYEKAWKSANKTAMKFYLTVNSFGLYHDTCSKVSNASVYDTVAGWGNITIKLPGATPSPIQALMVKETVLSTDSFYVNKQLASQPLLSLFSISKNGATTSDYRVYFYVANLPDYLMYVDYGSDATRSHPVAAYYSQDNLPANSGVEIPENNLIGFSEYPNPAHGSFNCKLSKSDPAAWTLSLINTLGQTVKTQYLSGTGNLQIPVDINDFKSGLYILNITDENGVVEASGKVEIR